MDEQLSLIRAAGYERFQATEVVTEDTEAQLENGTHCWKEKMSAQIV